MSQRRVRGRRVLGLQALGRRLLVRPERHRRQEETSRSRAQPPRRRRRRRRRVPLHQRWQVPLPHPRTMPGTDVLCAPNGRWQDSEARCSPRCLTSRCTIIPVEATASPSYIILSSSVLYPFYRSSTYQCQSYDSSVSLISLHTIFLAPRSLASTLDIA